VNFDTFSVSIRTDGPTSMKIDPFIANSSPATMSVDYSSRDTSTE